MLAAASVATLSGSLHPSSTSITTSTINLAGDKGLFINIVPPAHQKAIVFVGVQDGKAMLVRRDVDIHSTKSTMNSTGTYSSNSSTTTYSGMAGSSMYSGTAYNSGGGTYIPPNTPMDQMAGSEEIVMGLAPSERTLIEGYLVTVISVSDGMIEFEWKKLKD